MKIEIEIDTYKQLENLAIGFENPNDVILRLISSFSSSELKPPKRAKPSPSIYYNPSPMEVFKQKLLETKGAYRVVIFDDGSHEESYWDANRFDEKSNLEVNIRSGVLRNWQEKNIKTLILSIEPISKDEESLRKIMNEPVAVKKDSTRSRASAWLKKYYPSVRNSKFRSSKYFHDKDEWFFTLPSKFLEGDLINDLYLLLEREDFKESFHMLKIQPDFFVNNRRNIETRIQNGNEVFDLYISADKRTWLKTNNTLYPIDFSAVSVE